MPIVEVGFFGVVGVPNPADALVFIGPTIAVEIGFDPTIFAQLSGIPAPPVLPAATTSYAGDL